RRWPQGDIARDSGRQGDAAEGGPGARCPAVFIGRVKHKQNWCATQDSNLHCTPSEGVASYRIGLLARNKINAAVGWVERIRSRPSRDRIAIPIISPAVPLSMGSARHERHSQSQTVWLRSTR